MRCTLHVPSAHVLRVLRLCQPSQRRCHKCQPGARSANPFTQASNQVLTQTYWPCVHGPDHVLVGKPVEQPGCRVFQFLCACLQDSDHPQRRPGSLAVCGGREAPAEHAGRGVPAVCGVSCATVCPGSQGRQDVTCTPWGVHCSWAAAAPSLRRLVPCSFRSGLLCCARVTAKPVPQAGLQVALQCGWNVSACSCGQPQWRTLRVCTVVSPSHLCS